ncbi:MAG: pyridoxamine 5'-phosphate oxidase family protein [Pseudolabrys sp.]
MTKRFEEVVTTPERLRQIVSYPNQAIAEKVINHIDDICRRFIAASPFVVIATKGTDGLIDVSPKGDPKGFVAVLDEKTLAIPDRIGNRRVDSFENILVNPEVGLIFLIPGYGYTLRVSGSASIVRDTALQRQLAVDGKPPNLVLVVTVRQAFMHCAKCIARSKLWQPDAWPNTDNVPSLAEAMVAHARLARSISEQQSVIDTDFKTNMY